MCQQWNWFTKQAHSPPQYNKSSKLNEMDMGVQNCGVNGGLCYMNSSNGCESRNLNSICLTNKIYEIAPNISKMENNGLQDGVQICVILHVSMLNQYDYMEYTNEHHILLINVNN